MRKVSAVTDTADVNGEFTNGNVAQGVPPTILDSAIFNTWQRELVNIVTSSGMDLDPNDDGQILKAINKLLSVAAAVTSVNNKKGAVTLSAADVNAWNKTEADSRFIYKDGDEINWLAVNSMDYIIKRGLQDVVNNERQTNGMRIQGAGNLFVDIYQHERIGQYHFFGIHVANGDAGGWYEFRNDGSFNAGGTVGAGGGNGSKLHPDGNIEGSQWGGYLSNWLNNNISNAQNNAQNWAYQNLVQGVRLSGRTVIRDSSGRIDLPSGCVYTGMSGANYNPDIWAAYSAVQVLINGQWATIGTV